jgi:hypothetical protein
MTLLTDDININLPQWPFQLQNVHGKHINSPQWPFQLVPQPTCHVRTDQVSISMDCSKSSDDDYNDDSPACFEDKTDSDSETSFGSEEDDSGCESIMGRDYVIVVIPNAYGGCLHCRWYLDEPQIGTVVGSQAPVVRWKFGEADCIVNILPSVVRDIIIEYYCSA